MSLLKPLVHPPKEPIDGALRSDLAIEVRKLNFSFGIEESPMILKDFSLELPYGSRCLLVGHNGAGKSTLLKVLAGKRLTRGEAFILGHRCFFDAPPGVTYLGTEWAANPVVKGEVPVSRLLKSLNAEVHHERCAKLLDILDVDPGWKMNEVSDGQRRRVQIVLGLMAPWTLLLLDEVTVDLDVLVRSELLKWLKKETEERGCTILYATHIYDGLGNWPTHVCHMNNGEMVHFRAVGDATVFPELEAARQSVRPDAIWNSPLLTVAEDWLRADYQQRDSNRRGETKHMTRWDMLSENMKVFGDSFYDYWRR
ncbi:hypothetical protein SmJEL517_g05548 [Synchytrium microbalum]|uniref:ABC transporter domain-containing protein n=1 Tax=Synchytrium microbalum TaxID=1806994 RepID=A0A507BUT7_9FUNG|nr:uncharacterized protein SmJEL517_g05548 [Synchytrium microbalum]TPX31038.1 hypothetical protein SmJEL517_g05548 [Synchytrium microbalum]